MPSSREELKDLGDNSLEDFCRKVAAFALPTSTKAKAKKRRKNSKNNLESRITGIGLHKSVMFKAVLRMLRVLASLSFGPLN